MGNICVEQNKYPKAIKMYRMALDQVPEVHKGVRLRILQNIGTVFVKMGQYADAITSFEHIMEEKADFKTGKFYFRYLLSKVYIVDLRSVAIVVIVRST